MKFLAAPDYQSMSRRAANLISAQVILFPNSVLGLATGSTPLGIYRQLADWYDKGDIDFSAVRTVNLDEYCGLAPEQVQSYHYYMKSNFFSKINVDERNTNLPNGMAADLNEECRRYDAVIGGLGGIDLHILGIGHTGHIGFNEPGFAFDQTTHVVELNKKTIEANARFFNNISEVPRRAITMGLKAIMQAKKIVLVANGESKAEILERALFGPVVPEVPASILQMHPSVTVVADEAAFSRIRARHPETL